MSVKNSNGSLIPDLSDLEQKVLAEFNKNIPENRILQQLPYIINNAYLVDMDVQYAYRPDRLCAEYIGAAFLSNICLHMNKIGSIMQFTMQNVGQTCLLPKPSIISEILS